MVDECEVASATKFKFYSVPQLLALSEPGWLVDKLFPVESLVGLYGPSGHAKSFLALDLALSVARGGDWLGRSVRQGGVIYVAAEGGRSIRKRVAAWMRERGCEQVPGAFFLLEGVQVRVAEDIELLVRRIDELGPAPRLIVLDTLARCFVGGDENSAQEIGEFIHGLDTLKQKIGAAVMVLHHTGKKAQEVERGSTALRAAADVMIQVSKQDEQVTIHNNKQKDAEEFSDIHLQLKQVDFDGDTSCVLEVGSARPKRSNSLPSGALHALAVLASSGQDAMKTRDWLTSTRQQERTFYSHVTALTKKGYVEKLKRGLNQVTPQGRAQVETAATETNLHFAVTH